MAKQPKLEHVKFVRAKGQLYAYFNTGTKVNGKAVYAPLPRFGTTGFYDSYAAMLAARRRRKEVAFTVTDLIDRYQRSAEYAKLAPSTQRIYTLTLDKLRDQLGKFRAEKVERAHIREIINNRIDGNGSKNLFLSLVGILYTWGRHNDFVPDTCNPSNGIKHQATGEHQPWPQALIDAALTANHDRVRLAVHLLYYTGQRIGDVMQMRWADIRGGALWLTQQKTGKELRIPLHRDLRAELDRTPKRGLTIITNHEGGSMRHDVVRREIKAFAAALGFDAVPHGLRKSAVHALLLAGCTHQEVMAITGQSLGMVMHYAKRIDQHQLGDAAILKFEARDNQKAIK